MRDKKTLRVMDTTEANMNFKIHGLQTVEFCMEIVIDHYVTTTISTIQGFVPLLSHSYIG